MLLYSQCMVLSEKGMDKILELNFEKSRIHKYAFLIGTPIYLCIFIAALLPIYTYEVGFVTVFPVVILNCIPLSSIADFLKNYYQSSKTIYWCFQIVICGCLILFGQLIVGLISWR